MEFFEDGSHIKAIYEKSLTTRSFGVRKEVEELEATRIGLGLFNSPMEFIRGYQRTKYVLSVWAGRAILVYAVSP
jgi:hypothetical protein